MLASAIRLGYEIYNYYHPKYSDIPTAMVDLIDTVDGDRYIKYDVVYEAEPQADGTFIAADLNALAFGILQATRARISKTEYIACPGCGRTMYDLQGTLARIKAATGHLKGLKIGVMGCIVNGPGEMADADYGYVGAARGKVSLYRRKECVEKNIPEDEAIERLLQLIENDKKL